MEVITTATQTELGGTDGSKPIFNWASQMEEATLDQARNLAALPFAINHIALMPDAHPGYGMPIGGVLFAKNALVPYAVGVDIGCGVALLSTSLNVSDLTPTLLQVLLDSIAAKVPVGNGPGAQHLTPQYEVFEAAGSIRGEISKVATDAISHASTQMGSLGGGNHFIEVQQDEYGDVFVMLHSGSRSVGKKICDHWHKVAASLNERWYSDLPHKELAYLPWGTPEAHGYFTDMRIAMAWAERNRHVMLDRVQDALHETLGATSAFVTDIHHNYAAQETHLGINGFVHRKGAVRAREGEMVLIPGSMGTASYIGEGLGNKISYASCQHGAGRARSRTATVKSQTEEEFTASMTGILMGGNARNARDESPYAYKDIETVMADSVDLVRPVSRLTPMGVVKG
jgi:tRNA-splicing ligase RtcB (3'-phosphate/5'-hydroxy nucleic acid ligase)